MSYTSEPVSYQYPSEDQLSPMALALAESSFAKDWDITDQEENNYWNSLLTDV